MAIYCMEEYFKCLTLLAKEASVLNKITFWKLLSFFFFVQMLRSRAENKNKKRKENLSPE